jgi:hypothetical protein
VLTSREGIANSRGREWRTGAGLTTGGRARVVGEDVNTVVAGFLEAHTPTSAPIAMTRAKAQTNQHVNSSVERPLRPGGAVIWRAAAVASVTTTS